MAHRTIHVTLQDRERLELVSRRTQAQDRNDLADLIGELDRAVVVPAEEIPVNVITMRSRARLLDLDDGSAHEYTVVYPEEADVYSGKISVVAPVGAAMIGCREGDEIEWDVPAGRRRFKVEAVLYQPEAAGDTHL